MRTPATNSKRLELTIAPTLWRNASIREGFWVVTFRSQLWKAQNMVTWKSACMSEVLVKWLPRHHEAPPTPTSAAVRWEGFGPRTFGASSVTVLHSRYACARVRVRAGSCLCLRVSMYVCARGRVVCGPVSVCELPQHMGTERTSSGGSVQRGSPLHPRTVYLHRIAPGTRRGQLAGPSSSFFTFFSLRAVIRSSHTATAGPGPSRIISSCFKYAIWSGIHGTKLLISSSSASSSTTSFCFIHQHPALTPRCCLDHLSLCRNTSVCVCVCARITRLLHTPTFPPMWLKIVMHFVQSLERGAAMNFQGYFDLKLSEQCTQHFRALLVCRLSMLYFRMVAELQALRNFGEKISRRRLGQGPQMHFSLDPLLRSLSFFRRLTFVFVRTVMLGKALLHVLVL